MFRELNRAQRITILLVTHDPGVAGHAERVIHIHDGLIANDHVPGSAGGAPSATAARGSVT
jgi:ABC-type lipoprotein export system ATPase subunit